MFLTFFVNTIKADHDYADILRAAIASAPNDHRLGANEAPPAIISVFVGQYLAKVLEDIETRVGSKFDEQDEAILKLDLHRSIPELLLDNTDRNRTSPMAFTGNKFEFRAVGSSANCAGPMTILNSVMAETLKNFKVEVDALFPDKLPVSEALPELSIVKRGKLFVPKTKDPLEFSFIIVKEVLETLG
jgi:glutamine synthetase